MVQREARFTRKDGTVVKGFVLRDAEDDEPEPIDLDKKRPYRDSVGEFRKLRKEVLGDLVLPGNSADLIREARRDPHTPTEAATSGKGNTGKFKIGELIALRDEIFGDRVLPGNSADLLREARKIRESEIEGWA